MTRKQDRKLSPRLEENLKIIREELGVGVSFDAIVREVRFAGKDAALVFLDGFVKDGIMLRIMHFLEQVDRERLAPHPIEKLVRDHIGYLEVDTVKTIDEVLDQVLAGPLALLVDGETRAIIIDAREYPARSPEEPDLERVLRGSRDGMVETIVFNTALIRRRLRDPKLRTEIMQVGSRSKTDVVVMYIKDIANAKLVEEIKESIKAIDIDAIPMAEKSIEEFIARGKGWWNPFPIVRYTERPDVAAVHLTEGHILVVCDTSPSVIILPSTLFHHLQHAEEYREGVLPGAFTRLVRMFGILLSWFLPPLYVLITQQRQLLPESLRFLGPEKIGQIPLFAQFFLGEIGIDLIRIALIHTPNALGTSLGLIGAILLGEMAVKVGLFAPEAILYVALAALGSFGTPSFEFSQAVRLWRLVHLVAVGFFGWQGLVISLLANLAQLLFTRSYGIPYLWPLLPLNLKALRAVLFRRPVPNKGARPTILKPQDPDHMSGEGNG